MLVIFAGALAFVVLYNLTNINICERQKEIATLKVLGFFRREVSGYVFRETVLLSLIGTAFGLAGGVFFHRFVVQTAETDAAMFGRSIYPMSFVYAAALSLLFTLLVSLVMVVLSFVPMGEQKMLDLTVTVPETLHFHNAFADVFEKHTSSCRLVRTKTTNMGSLYKLHYRVEMKDAKQGQAFIDELRCRNGNLEIALCEVMGGVEEL